MRNAVKFGLNLISQVIVLPFVIVCKVEEKFTSAPSEVVFSTCAQSMAMLPGLPGAFLRRAFYTLTLEKCSHHCHIGFGSLISHRTTTLEDHVYIGNYALIGSAHIGEHCLIGSRASILSGTALHVQGEDGKWTPYSPDRLVRVSIARNAWVGEGALIGADIGEGSVVGAGSVATTKVKSNIVVAGNPARFVQKLEVAGQS